MDDWTYPYQDVDSPETQLALLDHDRSSFEAARRVRTQQIEAGRVAELEHTDVRDVADDLWPEVDVPLPFAAPPGAARTF